MGANDHYTIITADSHAGGSHAQYREYLDPAFRDDFDAWRGRYKNPFKDLKDDRRTRNWDPELRDREQFGDGVVGEVIFPNTVPPFFPSFVLFAQPPDADSYQHRLAGIRAHNRWLVDFCADAPERRAGIGQIFTNDLDDAIADAHWIKDHGLRGGVLLPNVAPDVKWVKPLYDREYDKLFAVLEELELPVNLHGGTGAPDYGKYEISQLLYITEVGFYSQRPLAQLLLSGVFERFPRLKVVITETGASWIPGLLSQLDKTMSKIRDTGQTGEIRYTGDIITPMLPSEYFARNVYVGVSQPKPPDAAVIEQMGHGHFMWGSDYPHDEGTFPFTREHLRQIFHDKTESVMRDLLGHNAAALYGFDLAKLARSPSSTARRSASSPSRSPNSRRTRTRRWSAPSDIGVARPSPQTDRVMAIVRLLTDAAGRGATMSELAGSLGQTPATLVPVLASMTTGGFVVRHPSDRRYHLGPALIEPGRAAAERFPDLSAVRRVMSELVRATGYPVFAFQRERDHARLVDSVLELAHPAPWMRVGDVLPIEPPLGSVFIAWSGTAAVDRWLRRQPADVGEVLRARMAAARERGFVVELRPPMLLVPQLSRLVGRGQQMRKAERLPISLSGLEGFLLDAVRPRASYELSTLCAPVRRSGRSEVDMSLNIVGFDRAITGRRVLELGEQARAAGDRLTAALAAS